MNPTDDLQDEQTERAYLAYLIVVGDQPSVSVEAVASVEASDFYNPDRRQIFKAMSDCANTGGIDTINITNKLKNSGFSNEHAIHRELSACIEQSIGISWDFRRYAKQLQLLHTRRKLYDLSLQLQQVATVPGAEDDAEGLIGKARAMVDEVSHRALLDEPVAIQPVANRVIQETLAMTETGLWGLETGVGDGMFDDLTGGIERGMFWVIAGIGGIGKSTLINALCRGVKAHNPDEGDPLICSTEMAAESVAKFSVAGLAGVHTRGMSSGDLNDIQRSGIQKVADNNMLAGIYVYYCGGLHVDKVLAMTARHKEKHGLPCVVVDVAGQLLGAGPKPFDQLNDVIDKLRVFSRRSNTCVIACVHLNRDIKDEPNKEPKIWHLRGSGEWEQKADRVLFVHRENYFGGQSPFTQIIQAKDRMHGDVRRINLVWNKALCKYQSGEQDEMSFG